MDIADLQTYRFTIDASKESLHDQHDSMVYTYVWLIEDRGGHEHPIVTQATSAMAARDKVVDQLHIMRKRVRYDVQGMQPVYKEELYQKIDFLLTMVLAYDPTYVMRCDDVLYI
jgi:hypothetical protein